MNMVLLYCRSGFPNISSKTVIFRVNISYPSQTSSAYIVTVFVFLNPGSREKELLKGEKSFAGGESNGNN